MKRPLAPVALTYASGILLADHLAVPLGALFVVSFGCFIACLLWERRRSLLLVPLLVLAGWTNQATRTAVIAPWDLRNQAGEQPQLATLRGTLCAAPTERVTERNGRETRRTLALLEVSGVRWTHEWEPASGCVAVSTRGELDSAFHQGSNVEVFGVLQTPPRPVAEGLFDYRAFLGRQGVHYQLVVESPADWHVNEAGKQPDALPLGERFQRWAKHTLALGLPGEDEPLRLLWTMAVGWKTGLTNEVAEPFMRSGTMHIFAISGLHIALIAGVLVGLLRVGRVPRGACGLVAVPLIWFYTAATDWQASAIRSTIMTSIVIAGWSLKRPGDLLNSLAGAAWIILVWDPQQLFQASFQLSFGVVLSIGLLFPPFEKARQRLLRTDPLLPAELRPAWQRRLDPVVRYVTSSLAISLAAWLGSLPLIAWYFHLFTPVSLLANMVVVPLSAPVLMSCLGSLLCASWLPGATVLFNHSGWFWMYSMNALSNGFARLPGAYQYMVSPSPAALVVYYALLFSLLNGWLLAPGRRKWAAAGLGLATVACVSNWHLHQPVVRITVLATRSGDALFIDAPGTDRDLLVDCSDAAGAQSLVKPFLRGQGAERLGALVLTHGDGLNVGGAETILHDFQVRRTVTSSVRFRSSAYRQVLQQLEESPEQWRQVRAGEEVCGWKILHPTPEDRFPLADDNALVLLDEFHGVRVLLLSDLGTAGQRALLARGHDLRADIVITGMPVRGEPVSDELLDAVQPQTIVVSAAEFPASEQIKSSLRDRLARRGVPVFYSRQCGSITLQIHPDRWRLDTRSSGKMIVQSQAAERAR